MRSMGRTTSATQLWSKARNVVSAFGAFQRPLKTGQATRSSSYTNARAAIMSESSASPPRKRSRKGCLALSACLVLLFTGGVIGAAVGVTESRKHHDGSGEDDEDQKATSVASICSRTLYPGVCNTTLAGTDTRNPQTYVSTAMKAAMAGTNKTLYEVEALRFASPTKNGTQYSTLETCKEVLTDCLDQLNTSMTRISTFKNLQSVQSTDLADIQQYMAAALTYHDTCLNGVQDFGVWNASDRLDGTHGEWVTKLLSNALSLVNSMSRVAGWGQVLQRHSRRRLQSLQTEHTWTNAGDEFFPTWIPREGRRLLQTAANPAPNAVVAKDGSGKFTSVQAAVDAAPASGTRWVIYVKKGVYSEYVSVPKGKKNLMMYGDGPGATVITGSKSVKGSGVTTFLSATFAVVSPGFILKDMTIRNTAGADGEQAVALRAGGDQQAFSNVNLEGYQDTLYAHALRQFYRGCTILGTIDYIFGNAAAVFQSCNLQARLGKPSSQNIYTASGRTDPGQNTGMSFLSCTVGAAPGLPDSYPTYLGRPWKPYAQTVFIKSTLANCVQPAGWLLWNGDPNSGKNANYGEYGNTGPGANSASRVSWSRQISVTEATKFTVTSFIAGQEWLPATSIAFANAL